MSVEGVSYRAMLPGADISSAEPDLNFVLVEHCTVGSLISRDNALPSTVPQLVRRSGLGTRLLPVMLLALCGSASAQTVAGPSPPPSEYGSEFLPDAPLPQTVDPTQANLQDVTLVDTPMRILKDQAAIWSSPVHIRAGDLKWAVPLGLATTVAITADHQAMSSVVSHNALFNHDNVVASDVLTGGFIAIPVALIGIGQMHGSPVSREAGVLSGEALLDGVVVEQGMKLIFWRERPSADRAHGKFFQSSAGIDSSFPSSHTVLSWSSAAVLAAEYPGFWTQAGIYTMATGVSLTRVLGQEHFPSDVLVGSAVGWLVGHYVYRKHHKVRMQ